MAGIDNCSFADLDPGTRLLPAATGTYNIMLVDSDIEAQATLCVVLRGGLCDLQAFPLGEAALLMLESFAPDLVFISPDLPDMDGVDLCRQLKGNPATASIPVIFLCTGEVLAYKGELFAAGAVDCLAKPLYRAELEAKIALQFRLALLQGQLASTRRKERQALEISVAQQATIFALVRLVGSRDGSTGSHLDNVRTFCRLLGERLRHSSPYAAKISADFIDCIQQAAPLHDIGKVAIPDHILQKTQHLEPEEFSVMKGHTVIGAETLQSIYNRYSDNPFIGMGIELALYHHERWDGSGYPDGLSGGNIPLSARIMALADYYSALRSDRCYRKGLPHAEVRDMIVRERGAYFDPEIVAAFLDTEEQFRRAVYPVDLEPPATARTQQTRSALPRA